MKTQNIIQPLRNHLQPLALAVTMGLGLATSAPALITIETVLVGDAGNTADTRYSPNRGAVASDFRIGKYEVQNSEYAAFLNAVAATDTNTLYNTSMATYSITRSGSPGSYSYTAVSGRENCPIVYMTWRRALRFANWMHNGQPTGAQDNSTTEDGAYQMSLGNAAVRKPGATWFVPSLDEWYKAAFYKGGGTSAGYWSGPYKSNTTPTMQAPPGTSHSGGSIWDNWGGKTPPAPRAVGSYNAGDSVGPYGTYDQGGNEFEIPETRGPYIMGGGGPYNDGPATSLASYNANPWGGGDGVDMLQGFRMAAASTPPAGYTSWAGTGDNAFDADANNDGVDNGMAWVLGAANKEDNATSLLPTLDNTTDPTYFIFNYNRLKSYPDTTIKVQYCSDLANWLEAVDNGTTIIITPGTGTGTTDPVEVKISRTLAVGDKLFARLNVVKAP